MSIRNKGKRFACWGLILLLSIMWGPGGGFGQAGPAAKGAPSKGGSPDVGRGPGQPGPATPAGKMASAKDDFTIVLHPAAEPNERAFTFLLPRGWIVKGGIYRVNPMQAGGSANSIEAKCDIAMQNDAAATIMVRRLPKINYADGPMATRIFPYGSNYNGAQVVAMPTVDGYLQWLFKTLHPGVSGVRVIGKQDRSDLAQAIQKYCESFNAQLRGMGLAPMIFHAGGMVAEYAEGGIRYKEGLFTVLMDWRQSAALWCNDHTIVMRAPAAEADTWKPVLDTILNSVKLNPQWVAAEMKGQDDRNKIVMDTLRDIQRIDREIAEHRRKTNAEIANDRYLTLTGQEEYTNPHTGKVERDTSEFKYRWTTPGGDYVYTNNQNYNPNQDPNEQRRDFKPTPVRKRFGD
jgi:hypothetical protein